MYLSSLSLYQEVWSPTRSQLPSRLERQRRSVSFFDIGFKGMYISFLKFRMTFTLTKYVEKRSSHDGDFPFSVRNELKKNLKKKKKNVLGKKREFRQCGCQGKGVKRRNTLRLRQKGVMVSDCRRTCRCFACPQPACLPGLTNEMV